ncbi:MAG: phospho-N-acetylmuramoyl-pentapeptide-transferase [Clostridia bacterium]|nr:phospho-N-acetylmuramoyl-pentapeptide-transferase [Clostridia bacterium]
MNSLVLCLIAFLISLTVTVFIEARLVPFLSSRAKQPIYEGGPSWHISKSGTPTMGGLAFVLATVISLSIAFTITRYVNEDMSSAIAVVITLLFAIGNSLVGIFDDLMKLHKKKNAGLSPAQKLLLQFILAVLFLMAWAHYFDDVKKIRLVFGEVDLEFMYYPFAIVLLLGIVNCANLSDGIDGLASSTSIAVGLAFLFVGILFSLTGVSVISAALIGGAAGFLIFNRHPAKIFMGDTGSLFLGALAVGLAFCSGNPASIILIGGVYVIEGVSVILQVVYYKRTKKRLFKMAPLHHHLEKCGFSENKICAFAVITTVILSALSLLFFKW